LSAVAQQTTIKHYSTNIVIARGFQLQQQQRRAILRLIRALSVLYVVNYVHFPLSAATPAR